MTVLREKADGRLSPRSVAEAERSGTVAEVPPTVGVTGARLRKILDHPLPWGVFLAAATLVVYWPMTGFPFLLLDDPAYVTQNPVVRKGVTLDGVAWAFTTFRASNWHPLTWLSHMLDVEWFGLEAGRHHLVNVLLHVVNAVALFLVLRGMTGVTMPAGITAALFALHPVHVESVAWISERKDVLSALFWILAMGAYARYVARGGAWRYTLVLLLFSAGLLSKPMAVTFPFTLLLLDYWPLRRSVPLRRLVLEKVPFLVLSAASCAVTLMAQRKGGALSPSELLPFGLRAMNAVASYAAYLGKSLWPASLAVFYPHPVSVHAGVPAQKVAIAGAAITAVTFLAFSRAARRPYLPVGWFWFLGTLVPVIGFVQVGGQAMADRYTYLPLIGGFMVFAWGARDLLAGRGPRWRIAAITTGFVLLAALAVVSRRQVTHWRGDVALFSHAVQVTDRNWRAYTLLGMALEREGRTGDAALHYAEALRIRPDTEDAHNNLGAILQTQGRAEEAERHYREALRIRPDYPDARYNLGLVLEGRGFLDDALVQYAEALRLRPSPNVRARMEIVLMKRLPR